MFEGYHLFHVTELGLTYMDGSDKPENFPTGLDLVNIGFSAENGKFAWSGSDKVDFENRDAIEKGFDNLIERLNRNGYNVPFILPTFASGLQSGHELILCLTRGYNNEEYFHFVPMPIREKWW